MSDDPDPVPAPRQVHCELETLREMGTHDLLSPEALDAMETYDFDAAREWALEDPDRYARAVLAGTTDRSIETASAGQVYTTARDRAERRYATGLNDGEDRER